MLDVLRKASTGILAKLLLGLLILSFGAWGIGDMISGSALKSVVAEVGDAEISPNAFTNAYRRELERRSSPLGQPLTSEQAKREGLPAQVLESMILDTLFKLGAQDLGLGVSDRVVLAQVQSNPAFFNAEGEFSRYEFDQLLQNNGISEAYYLSTVRSRLSSSQFLSPIRTGVTVPTSLAETLYRFQGETRSADVVRIAYDDLTDIQAPTAEQLSAYHQERAANFQSPETRSATAVVLSAEGLTASIEIFEDELQAAYDERADDFITPETRKLRQIAVQNEEAAKQAKDLLDQGGDFAEALKQVGGNTSMEQLGNISHAAATTLSPELADAVFAQAPGGITAPVKSILGWHVIKVEAILPPEIKSLDQVREQLQTTLRTERAVDVLFEQSNRLNDLLGGGMTLEEAAAEMGLTPVKMTAIDASGAGLSHPNRDELVGLAFTTDLGMDSELTELAGGAAYATVRVDDVMAPQLMDLDQVRDRIAAMWTAEHKAARAGELAQDLLTRLEGGEDIAAAAKALGLTMTTTPPFGRDGRGLAAPMPASLLRQMFALNTGKAAAGPGNNAHVVARVAEVIAADPARDADKVEALKSALYQDILSDLVDQMATALQIDHPVSVNTNVFDQATN